MTAVLDASALLAVLFREPGGDVVAGHVDGARVSSVNAAEVLSRLTRAGADPSEAYDVLRRLPLEIVPFTEAHALATAALAPLGLAHGLSLGDRACLALAADLRAAAVTADRAWRGLPLGIEIVCVR